VKIQAHIDTYMAMWRSRTIAILPDACNLPTPVAGRPACNAHRGAG